MYLLTTKLVTRKGVSERLIENTHPREKDADSVTLQGFARRVLTNCVVAIKNRFHHSKIHYYHISDQGTSFFLDESTEFTDEVYITSYQSLVEPADLIKIEYASAITTYRIVELQNYLNSPDIWVARLKALPNDCEPGQA